MLYECRTCAALLLVCSAAPLVFLFFTALPPLPPDTPSLTTTTSRILFRLVVSRPARAQEFRLYKGSAATRVRNCQRRDHPLLSPSSQSCVLLPVFFPLFVFSVVVGLPSAGSSVPQRCVSALLVWLCARAAVVLYTHTHIPERDNRLCFPFSPPRARCLWVSLSVSG